MCRCAYVCNAARIAEEWQRNENNKVSAWKQQQWKAAISATNKQANKQAANQTKLDSKYLWLTN